MNIKDIFEFLPLLLLFIGASLFWRYLLALSEAISHMDQREVVGELQGKSPGKLPQ